MHRRKPVRKWLTSSAGSDSPKPDARIAVFRSIRRPGGPLLGPELVRLEQHRRQSHPAQQLRHAQGHGLGADPYDTQLPIAP
jgi:hypothetical protein